MSKMVKYILGIDQSTQGTKAILADESGKIIDRVDRSHRQIVNEKGWISHDLDEIYQNVLVAIRDVVKAAGIRKEQIAAIGISNQRETTAIWDNTGKALNYAVVWQCARAKDITDQLKDYGEMIQEKTGLQLSPYFPAAKMAWLLQNVEDMDNVYLGTMDTWLIYRMTNGNAFKTDYSNASRTQLFNIKDLKWDEEICKLFHIPQRCLPEVCDSNSEFGMTDLDGFLQAPIPIQCAMGDSHAALFGQGCHKAGMIKTTYGTGSSIMMNTGEDCPSSNHGLVTSLAWGINGKVNYVLEGNINYTGAVITWLKDEVKLINSPDETEKAALEANPADETVLIPAFSGLSAPYWSNNAKAMLYGMTRTTGKNEIIRAALESIIFQIEAVLSAMSKDSGIKIEELRVDGGPTQNKYLMQMQSNISNVKVAIPDVEELSALGVIYMAGITIGLYDKDILFKDQKRTLYCPCILGEEREKALKKWKEAIEVTIQ